jgi:hypothetical protein
LRKRRLLLLLKEVIIPRPIEKLIGCAFINLKYISLGSLMGHNSAQG